MITREIQTRPGNDWLRWHAGEWRTRKQQFAVYDENWNVRFEDGPETIIFHLLGYGSVRRDALAMACEIAMDSP